MNTIRTFSRAAGAVGVAGALVLVATPASAADTATVSVLHAVPDTPVDVYANGERLLDDFQPGTLTDPLRAARRLLRPGRLPGRRRRRLGHPLLSADGVAVPAGANATVVAHLKEDGSPVLTPFVNDVSAVAAGQARVTVRHTAAAPAVDVRAGGTPVISGLTNPDEIADRAGRHGQRRRRPRRAPAPWRSARPTSPSPRARNTIVYAWGAADKGGFKLAVQTISAHSAPSGVPGGSAGLVDDGALPMPLMALSVAGLVAAGAGALRLARSRG